MTRPISRRTALTIGGVGVVGASVGGVALWRGLTPFGSDVVSGGEFGEPEVLRSTGGKLEVRLEAARSEHQIAGRARTTLGFNGTVPGPTLSLRPGDTLRIELVNRLEEATNLHVHGLHVSPEGAGDDVFVSLGPGETRQYEYALPADHPTGVFWYHPHHHGTVADQVFGGLYGAILVEEDDPVPVERERVMVVSDITLDGSESSIGGSGMDQMMGREGELVLLNGLSVPVLKGRAGERERWRIVNACISRFLALRLPGQEARVVGRDGSRSARSAPLEDLVVPPGGRLDVVVDLVEGDSEFRLVPVDRGSTMGSMMRGSGPLQDEPVSLARLRVAEGDAVGTEGLPPMPELRDLRDEQIAGRRSLRFQMGMGGMMRGGAAQSFTFDGRAFDPDRIDQQVRLGTVEEWVIGNDTGMDHPFHLHVWPMQVLEVGGQPVADPVWLDVVNVPAGSRVTVRVAFEDFGGRTVYHCHILDHEDRGMMGTIRAAT